MWMSELAGRVTLHGRRTSRWMLSRLSGRERRASTIVMWAAMWSLALRFSARIDCELFGILRPVVRETVS